MKKNRFKLLITLLCCTFVLSGCFEGKSKTYSKSGINIELPDNFFEKELVSSTYYLESTQSIVSFLKEDFSIIYKYAPDLNSYSNLVLTANKLNAKIQEFFEEEIRFNHFDYEKEMSGKNYYYKVVMIEGINAYWLLNFACETKNKEEFSKKFLDWTKTITFTAE